MTASALAAGAVVLAGTAAAAVPATVTHQGRLYDERDVPISATLDVVFALYDERDASTPLWSEVHSITFEDGFFSVRLGSIVPFEQAIFDGAERYLGITVGDDVELEPRATVASVPYALLAGNVNGDITPTSVTVNTTSGNTLVLGERGVIVNGVLVIDENGEWVGSPTGLQGPQGLPGPIGPAGATGPEGRVGATGPAGAAGPTGPAGPIGAIGPTGAAGPTGPTGPEGVAGPRGPEGPAGPAGAAGPMGPEGPVGAIGPEGPMGPDGPMGPTGPEGPTGATGPEGPMGPRGPEGPVGAIGPEGPMGPRGPEGPVGAIGPEGPMGPRGPEGPVGAIGPEGPMGPLGPEGPVGPMGPVGPTGPQGPVGPTGPQGPRGFTGPVGPTGPQGVVLTLTVQGVGPHAALPVGRPVDFFGPTALVAVSSTSQSIYATAHRYLGTDGSPADSLKLYMCYQRVRSGPSGTVLDEVQAVGLGMAGGRVPADTRVPFGLSAVITNLTAGTYNIGMCGQTLSPNWTSNDYGYLSILLVNG
ncbi:collagen-like protein [Sorangium sp. So ce1504]|uniref:collagen-like protein n=1 Tax=Sorangium sp. So ce1504 TaxID=3133337 RepID=UPI003F61EADF